MNVFLHNQNSGTQSPPSAEAMEQGIRLETLRILQRMSRQQEGVDQDADRGGTDVRHVRRTLAAYHHLRAMVEKQPGRIVQEFLDEVKEELGLVEGQPWTMRQFAQRIPWGSFRTNQRNYEMQIAVYEYLKAGKPHSALAQLVQNMKAIHQCTLDGGNWKNAWLLTGLVDPGQRKRFGGTEEELEIVNAYGKMIEDLDKRLRTTTPPSSNPQQEGEAPRVTLTAKQKAAAKKRLAAQQQQADKG